ncbi:DMT family transporter [Photobacterium leiognathi]|uniref:DMT family transporter n=1 Tax=Photobacterium leiognathi TaxID=553611 RepID=UPI002738E7CB|nr:DMT family transporter [Photobacterium leiognathi]
MLKNCLTLLAIGLIWGSQFIFQTMALEAFSPVWIGTLRAVFGAFTVVVICRLMGIRSTSSQWRLFALIGLLEATIPFVLVPWAQKELSSSATAILMGTLPFYALLLAPLFIQNSKLTKGSLFSVCIGFAGLLVLFYPDIMSGNQQFHMLSALAVILAAICFAIALLLLNRVQTEHPMIVARNVLIMASIQLVVFASITTPFTLDEVSSNAIGSIIYLGVMCAGVVYYLYMMSIKNAGAVFTSMTNYLVPAVGVFIAALITDDSIQTTTWVALVVILSALLIKQMVEKNEQ